MWDGGGFKMIFPEYQHGGDIYGIQGVDLDFSVNLHPAGMPLPIQEAIIANIDRYDVYPDPYCRKLAIRVAELWQLDPSWLCFGNGAADLIFRLFFVLRPRRLLILAPTFSEYEEAAAQVGSEIVRFYLKPEEDSDLDPRFWRKLRPRPIWFSSAIPTIRTASWLNLS